MDEELKSKYEETIWTAKALPVLQVILAFFIMKKCMSQKVVVVLAN